MKIFVQYLILVILLCSLAFGQILLDIDYEDDPIRLTPNISADSVTESRWSIRACRSCKLMLKCTFLTICNDSNVMGYDGEEFFHKKPEKYRKFNKASVYNGMEVTIINVGPNVCTTCDVISTKPYLYTVDEPIDSSEFGWGHSAVVKPTCPCGWSNKKIGRVIGGQETGIHEYPFMVRIRYAKTGLGFCGGAIISPKHVLTAAHCLYQKMNTMISVIAGEHNLMTMNETGSTREYIVKQMIIHPDYNRHHDHNDIGLLYLEKKIIFSVKIGPVCLPQFKKVDLVGQHVKVMGWGYSRDRSDGGKMSPLLRKATLQIIDPNICRVLYETIDDIQICAFSMRKDTCGGDSGGPVVLSNPQTHMFVLVGIVSFGGAVCGHTDPSVNTNVEHYIDWIQKHISATEEEPLCH